VSAQIFPDFQESQSARTDERGVGLETFSGWRYFRE